MKDRKAGRVSFVVSADGSRIAYETAGSGPLLISVFGAICHREFFPVRSDVQELAKRFTVVNYDRRGRGESTESGPWSLEKEVQDIAALIEAHGGRASLYGHSSGAVLALEAALRLEGRIEKVVVYDASYVSDASEQEEFRTLKVEVEGLLGRGQRARALRVFLAGIGMPRPFIALLPLFPGWKTMTRMAHTISYDIALTEDFAPVERLRGMARPTLLLAGAKSPPSLQGVLKTLAQTIPSAESSLLPGQDHMASMKALLPLMTRFLL